MNSYVLSCCSTADLPEEMFREYDIHYICFHYFLDGKEYPDDLGKSIPFEEFYKAMANGADTSRSTRKSLWNILSPSCWRARISCICASLPESRVL